MRLASLRLPAVLFVVQRRLDHLDHKKRHKKLQIGYSNLVCGLNSVVDGTAKIGLVLIILCVYYIFFTNSVSRAVEEIPRLTVASSKRFSTSNKSAFSRNSDVNAFLRGDSICLVIVCLPVVSDGKRIIARQIAPLNTPRYIKRSF